MTRVNQPDSLLTEIRDIKRRLRALETRSAALAQPVAPAADVPNPEETRDDKTE
ncbi:hypothetical protein LWC34_02900 [Kibdelosporangium philippinense]|uniref:Uncharacterized protein n=1 Tax=Kibdelosporangium philippinense TaxID=211113 RepID=A0ABS8Z1H7_9PSEU|nr:hypothetical protein [Kibdelosporangium philippinense]MCE7001793.1 hypothetical protein [Kibdelosporangium philippinense]